MQTESVSFNGQNYNIRVVNDLKFGPESLEEQLLDEDMVPVSDEADYIDNNIAGYIPDDVLVSSSDDDIWALIYQEPMPRDIFMSDIVYEEDLTDEYLNNWFLNLTIPNKQKVLVNANGNWLNYNLLQKRMWYNTITFKK